MRRLTLLIALSCMGACLLPVTAQADFGLNGFDVTFNAADGTPAIQAGSHPFTMTTRFQLNRANTGSAVFPDQAPKEVRVALPPGFVGYPTATAQCANSDFSEIIKAISLPSCADSTAVGIISVELSSSAGEPAWYTVPVYNLVPPPGAVSELGFVVTNVPITVEVTVRKSPPYDVIAASRSISQALNFLGVDLILWGDPADPAHDRERGSCIQPGTVSEMGEYISVGECHTSMPPRPFLTLPTECASPLITSYEADSWQAPESWVSGESETHDDAIPPQPLALGGCSRLGFSPTVDAQPTTSSASSPTGLDFDLDVHDEGLTSPTGIAQSDIRKVVVTLPEGMTANPALAEGLEGCSEAELERETIDAAPGEGCPSESKIGAVEVETPLLEQTLKGSLFIARQNENPFHSLLALYVIIKSPETGILLKLPGEVEPNPVTGQLVSVFEDLPQLPFSHFRLSFRQGQRSPLVTPPLCGTYTTTAELTPWSGSAPIDSSAQFTVSSGVGGGPCPVGGLAPFAPGLVAGTASNAAGSYSPLDIRITRNDGEQEITGFSTRLPEGLSGSLTGIPFCGPAQIAAAQGKTGAEEQAEPSCPAASLIGHSLVGVGVGSVLAYTPGRLYLAGPYEGAPFSVVSITSAKVGPFDLGTVVVHLPLDIDPVTAQVSIPQGPADQIPYIIDGIVVHVRDIQVMVDRERFMINPTSCERMGIEATVYGSGQDFSSPADDVPSTAITPFQAADCASLAFKPTFKVSTSAKTSRKDGASLHVALTYPKEALGNDANIREVKVELPKALPSELKTLQKACTEAQFDANPAGCPAESAVGYAKALTPILPVPLEGPAYFVSRGAQWPELIVVLQGYGITIDLHGETHISGAGITSSTFATVPDQPVQSFELTLPESEHSALAANGDLCTQKLVMPTHMIAQNGASFEQQTKVAVEGCPTALSIRSHRVKHRTLTLRIYAPSAGKLSVSGKGVKAKTRKPDARKLVTLRVHEKRASRRKVKVQVVFTPKAGKARKRQSKSVAVRFKAPGARRASRSA